MSEENLTPETGAEAPQVQEQSDGEMISRSEVENLMKAVKSERGTRKDLERQLKDVQTQLEKFAEINPDEYTKLQAEAAEAARLQATFGEQRELIEQKYSRQASEATAEAEKARNELASYRKNYALEKAFHNAGGRTDSIDNVSFFSMLADNLGGNFRHEADGSLTVVDGGGDPVLDKETGKRISAEDFIASFKVHPVYGTFFKGAKGSGGGMGYAGTDANGMPMEDFSQLSNTEKFQRAWK